MRYRPILISAVQYHDDLLAGRVSQVEVARRARPLGVDGLEARPDYWRDRDAEIDAVRHLAAAEGLIVTYATGLTLFGSEPEVGAPLRQALDEAARLGASLLRVFSGVVPAAADEAGWAGARARVEAATAAGIVLALENFGRAPGHRVATLQAVLARLPLPALGTNVDLGNYAGNGEDLVAAIQTLGPRIVSTHLRDQQATATLALGEGTLPLGPALAALAALPQPIIHCFEFEGNGDPAGRIRRSLAFLDRLERS